MFWKAWRKSLSSPSLYLSSASPPFQLVSAGRHVRNFRCVPPRGLPLLMSTPLLSLASRPASRQAKVIERGHSFCLYFSAVQFSQSRAPSVSILYFFYFCWRFPLNPKCFSALFLCPMQLTLGQSVLVDIFSRGFISDHPPSFAPFPRNPPLPALVYLDFEGPIATLLYGLVVKCFPGPVRPVFSRRIFVRLSPLFCPVFPLFSSFSSSLRRQFPTP